MLLVMVPPEPVYVVLSAPILMVPMAVNNAAQAAALPVLPPVFDPLQRICPPLLKKYLAAFSVPKSTVKTCVIVPLHGVLMLLVNALLTVICVTLASKRLVSRVAMLVGMLDWYNMVPPLATVGCSVSPES